MLSNIDRNNKSNKYIAILLTMISILLIISNAINGYNINGVITGLFIMIHSIYLMYHYRKNMGLFIAFFFMLFSNYSIVMGVYWDKSMRPDVLYSQITSIKIYGAALTTLLVFESTLTLFSILNLDKMTSNRYIYKRDSQTLIEKLVVIACAIVVIVIFFTQFRLGDDGERAEISPIFEYKIIFIIIGMIYSRQSKQFKIMWLLLIIITSGASFINGNRVDGLVAVIAYGVHYYSNIKASRLALILFGGMFFMIGIGYMRAGFSLDAKSWIDVWTKIKKEKFTFDTAIWAYFPAVSSVAIAEKNINSLDLLELLKQHIIYIFAGGGYGKQRLQYITRSYFFHAMGFFSPIYFYVWIRMFSGVLFGILVNAYIKLEEKIKDGISGDFRYGIYLYFASMTPRWYLYDPFSLIRGVMLFGLSLFIVSTVLKLLEHKSNT